VVEETENKYHDADAVVKLILRGRQATGAASKYWLGRDVFVHL